MEHNSVIATRFCNHECMSLPQENCREICIEREDIKEQFYEFNQDFIDEFNESKA